LGFVVSVRVRAQPKEIERGGSIKTAQDDHRQTVILEMVRVRVGVKVRVRFFVKVKIRVRLEFRFPFPK
jgi:hypothetical protein